MYYNAASPNINLKLNHQHDPWNLNRLQPGPANPQPPSPGYAVYTHHQHQHPNGIHTLAHHHPPPNHSHSLSLQSAYSQQDPVGALRPASPNGTSSSHVVGSPHWQQQMMKAEACRQSSSPHHRARASALATRNTTKAAVPILDPNKLDVPDSHPEGEEQSHPSSTVAPVRESKIRTTQVSESTSTWTTLDIGGMRVKNLSPSLFSFTYLTTLFLNHNNLTSIPPEIERLRALVLLDLSGNQLMSLPPELGMLTSLRELHLFDNHLTTLPSEMGTLFELELVGLEGNPLEATLRAIVQNEGTRALVAHLRDTCPVPAPPPERLWTYLESDAERKLQEADPASESFSVLCYNILHEAAGTSKMYPYTPTWALAWDYRKELILTEIMSYDADFLCLQEVDVAQYEDYFMHNLANQGYEGVYWPRSRARTMTESARRMVDGSATFFKTSKYQMVEKHLIEFAQLALQRPDFKKTDDMFNRVMHKDHIAIVCLLEHRVTGSRLILVNVYVYWDPAWSDVKLVQVGLLMEEVEKIAHQFAKFPPKPPPPPAETNGAESPKPPPQPPTYADGTKIPTIVCGDFNSVPDSGVYSFLANGTLQAHHPDFLSHVYGKFTDEGMEHGLSLKSAYAAIGELPLTNYVPSFRGSLDYIWCSTNTLSVTSLLGEVDQGYLSKVVGFPNAHFPSDHICILSEFRVKPTKDAVARTQPNFRNHS